MKLLLLGRRGSINHWLEEAAGAFGAAGHEVRLGVVRDPRLHPALQSTLAGPIADRIAARVATFTPQLILAVGGFHVPFALLQRLAALPGRPPIAAWVGDAFDATARPYAALYDLVAYTDTGLERRHAELGFAAPALFAPHAVDPRLTATTAERMQSMVFVAAATPERRALIAKVERPVAIHGPGWAGVVGHEVYKGRLAAKALPHVYARHLASLNVRNEFNVLTGLNQRNFQPYLTATPLVTDDQADLPLCFDSGTEAFVWRNAAELNDIYARLLADPAEARRVGEAGRARVLADHTYDRRLALIAGHFGEAPS
jgi:spore maturation protein CgeB